MSDEDVERAIRVKSNHVDEMSAHTASQDYEKLELLYPNNIVTVPLSDPAHPHTWSLKKRLIHTMMFGFTTLSSQFSATVLSPSTGELTDQFHVGAEVGVLAMSIYVLGNGIGPMLFAPLSEVYGRKIGVFVPYFVSALLMVVVANVNSIAAVVVFRFFAGVFAAAPIVSSGGAMADMWPASQRASALALYGVCIVAGSSFAPTFGSLLIAHNPNYGWRWSCWLGGIMGLLISTGNFLFLSETYLPRIEQARASHLRHETGKWALHAKHEEWRFSLEEFFKVHCARPILMFMTPIVFLMATYASFVYGVLFLVISSVPTSFMEIKHFGFVSSHLPLTGSFLGFTLGAGVNVLNSYYYVKKAKRTGGQVGPEDRLPAMMMLSWMFPVGCFVYAWTMQEHIHWIVPIIGLVLVFAGLAVIFQGALVYMVDAYTRYAASAIAANTMLRSIYGGAFPLFTSQMYKGLGHHWATSLVGFVSLLLLPIPFAFYYWGARIRKHNPHEALLS